MALSPMMQQYMEIKSQHSDAIVMFRLGDFYEMFFEDAKTVSKELDLTLTGRDCGEKERAPMCGVPYHAADTYIGKLVCRGYTVVICEQLEDPATAKGIVKRDVTRIVTPGTVTDTSQLDENKNNYMASLYVDGEESALSVADISTGEVFATCFSGDGDLVCITNELAVYSPKEIITNIEVEDYPKLYNYLSVKLKAVVKKAHIAAFDREYANERLAEISNKGIMPDNCYHGVYYCLGGLFMYVDNNLRSARFKLKSFELYGENQYMKMDANTRRNLELTETMRDKSRKGSLLGVLDKTLTSPGARLLRRSIEMPLVNQGKIVYRQKAVEDLYCDFLLRDDLGRCLCLAYDLERIMPKLTYGSANAKDLRAIYTTLSLVPKIKELLGGCRSKALCDIRDSADELEDVCELIEKNIVENPPFSIREGGFIAEGCNAELDELRAIRHNAKDYLAKIELREREKTGIKTLKIGYNRVFGYYIEVSKAYKDMLPEGYIRKQTLTTGERYITEELKQLEDTIISSVDRISTIEYNMFMEISSKVASEAERIAKTTAALAELDMYLSFATVATENGYVCPEVTYDSVIDIKDGRHPVVEKFVKDGYFVPNSARLDTQANRLMIITGPNMAGKSTYMRQTALITLMAQIGSFVPAAEARIGIVDKLFTRVGASDDLASGQSTFMLEMTEVAYILNNATKKSLIIYDEIGRGTSTYDGMSIAKAVAEYTAGKKLGAKTMFATHYHELTSLEDEIDGVVNYSIAAKKRGEDIIFLRKIVKGGADDSYGIEVAKLAGVPQSVIKRAKEVLSGIEAEGRAVKNEVPLNSEEGSNITLTDCMNDVVCNKLKETSVDTLTPIEALNLVYQLKQMLI